MQHSWTFLNMHCVLALVALLAGLSCASDSSTGAGQKRILSYVPLELDEYAPFDNVYGVIDSIDDRLKRDDSARPGLLRFGKRDSDMPGVLRFGKRSDSEIPGLLRFGKRVKLAEIDPLHLRYARSESISKKEMPGVLRFGKRSSDMPGVLRFGKRDSEIPGLLRFGRK